MELVHHHLIYQAQVGSVFSKDDKAILRKFLFDLVDLIEMEVLIQPVLEFSHQKAWTGTIGIVTSHIAFHYFSLEQYIQLDIYSCKEFDREKAIKFIDEFWKSTNVFALLLDRKVGQNFKVESISPQQK